MLKLIREKYLKSTLKCDEVALLVSTFLEFYWSIYRRSMEDNVEAKRKALDLPEGELERFSKEIRQASDMGEEFYEEARDPEWYQEMFEVFIEEGVGEYFSRAIKRLVRDIHPQNFDPENPTQGDFLVAMDHLTEEE